MLGENVSIYIEQDDSAYIYETILGKVRFRVPKHVQFNPEFNGGRIPNSVAAKYIKEALERH